MIKYFNRNRILFFLSLIVYLLVNSLFVLKYGSRQNFVSQYLLLFLYIGMVGFGLYFINKRKEVINKAKHFKYYFLGGSLVVFIAFVLINIFIDGNTLNTDRWSAMEVTIQSVLNGEYPYMVKDHLDQTSSNLPGLFYIGLPFYLIKDVGLLQPFVFLLMSFLLFKFKASSYDKLLVLFLFLVSPAYLWEVFAKSDLMSNVILLVLFLFFWSHTYKGGNFKNPILLAFFCAFFVLTRVVVVIPLTLFLFGGFIKSSVITKLKFVVSFLAFILIISLPFLITIPDFETVVKHNPFNHQTRYAPKILQGLFIMLPFVIALRINTIQSTIKYSFLLFAVLLFLTLAINSVEEGFNNNLYGNLFDISYLGMIIPFSVFSIVLDFKNKKNTMHA